MGYDVVFTVKVPGLLSGACTQGSRRGNKGRACGCLRTRRPGSARGSRDWPDSACAVAEAMAGG